MIDHDCIGRIHPGFISCRGHVTRSNGIVFLIGRRGVRKDPTGVLLA
jgi:hypothetical protein